MPWVSQVKLYYIWQAEIMLELWSLLRVTSCLFSFSHSLEMCRKAALAQSVSSRLSHTEGHDAREVFYLKYFFPSLYDVRMLSFKKKKKNRCFIWWFGSWRKFEVVTGIQSLYFSWETLRRWDTGTCIILPPALLSMLSVLPFPGFLKHHHHSLYPPVFVSIVYNKFPQGEKGGGF